VYDSIKNFLYSMTSYEFIAIIVSLVALFMPLIKKICVYIFYKRKIKFYPNGQIILFFNQSGAYFRIYGTYESINDQSLIRSINVKIVRRNDNFTLNYQWSSFISPVIQNISNNSFVDTRAIAHPFIIMKNSIYPAFIEFSDPSNSSEILIRKIINKYTNDISIDSQQQFHSLYEKLVNSKKFEDAKHDIAQEFVWKIGIYDVNIEVKFNSNVIIMSYYFEINENEYSKLYMNIEEILLCNFKKLYYQNINFYTANIPLHDKFE